MRVKFMPRVIAAVTLLLFLMIMTAIHLCVYRAWPDGRFIFQVVVLPGIIGVSPMLFKKFFFGSVFLTGGIVGLIIDCLIGIGRNSQGRPLPAGGFAFMLCLLIGFVLGIVAELAFRPKGKNLGG